MIIDGHQHFWQLDKFDYPWLEGVGSVLQHDFLPATLAPLLKAAGVDKTVAVQAHQSVEEARWLLEQAEQYDFIGGVVGWVDLRDPGVGDVLDELCLSTYFKGVRHVWHDEPDDAWILQPQVLEGLRQLSDRNLPFDFLTFPRHLEYIPEVLDRVSDLKTVVDHISKPAIASGELEPWRRDLKIVSDCPGVHCKISGMVTEADHAGWKVSDLNPYVSTVIELFGADRLIYGSDWPVCMLAASYDQVIAAAREATQDLSEEQLKAVFGGNAERFYKL